MSAFNLSHDRWLVCAALELLCLAVCAPAATVTNYMVSGNGFTQVQWLHYYLAVNVGDTVVWLNQQQSPPTNYVASYAGDWSSPVLGPGESFAFTFTNAGFFAYRTGIVASPGPCSGPSLSTVGRMRPRR
jgi:hypothetical protein